MGCTVDVSGGPLQVPVISRHQLTLRDPLGASASEPLPCLAGHDGHLAARMVAIYDLAGLADSTDNDLRNLLAVVGLEPHARPDPGEGALNRWRPRRGVHGRDGGALLDVLEPYVARHRDKPCLGDARSSRTSGPMGL